MSDQFFYLQLKFTPKMGHTFTDEREVFVEIPKKLVRPRGPGQSIEPKGGNHTLDLANRAALSTFPTDAERVVDLYDEGPPIWYSDRLHPAASRLCGLSATRVARGRGGSFLGEGPSWRFARRAGGGRDMVTTTFELPRSHARTSTIP